MMVGMSKIISETVVLCTSSPLRRVESRIADTSAISSAVTKQGPDAPEAVKFLPAVTLSFCHSRTEPSFMMV